MASCLIAQTQTLSGQMTFVHLIAPDIEDDTPQQCQDAAGGSTCCHLQWHLSSCRSPGLATAATMKARWQLSCAHLRGPYCSAEGMVAGRHRWHFHTPQHSSGVCRTIWRPAQLCMADAHRPRCQRLQIFAITLGDGSECVLGDEPDSIGGLVATAATVAPAAGQLTTHVCVSA